MLDILMGLSLVIIGKFYPLGHFKPTFHSSITTKPGMTSGEMRTIHNMMQQAKSQPKPETRLDPNGQCMTMQFTKGTKRLWLSGLGGKSCLKIQEKWWPA